MQIKPDEITSILKSRIEGLEEGEAELTEVGTVLSIADGWSPLVSVSVMSLTDPAVALRLSGWSPAESASL